MATDKEKKKEVQEWDLSSLFDELIKKEKAKRRLIIFIRIFLIVAVVFCLIYGAVSCTAMVQDISMQNALAHNSVAVLDKISKNYKIGDIVMFYSSLDGKYLIKRVVAVSGDVISVKNETGEFILNGETEKNPDIQGKTYRVKGGAEYPLTVEKGKFFVMGDNREDSIDSRHFGVIDETQIIAKVIFSF